MRRRKIAIFSTSEIFRHWYPNIGLPIISKVTRKDGRVVTFASTGSLEKAMKNGYKIYVVSTRESLSEEDTWWRKLVNKNRIFLADKQKKDEFTENSGWIRLFAKLGLDYPLEGREGIEVSLDSPEECPPAHWYYARIKLNHKYGMSLGRDFANPPPQKPELLRNIEEIKGYGT